MTNNMEENYNKLSENEIKNELIKVKGWTINKNKFINRYHDGYCPILFIINKL